MKIRITAFLLALALVPVLLVSCGDLGNGDGTTLTTTQNNAAVTTNKPQTSTAPTTTAGASTSGVGTTTSGTPTTTGSGTTPQTTAAANGMNGTFTSNSGTSLNLCLDWEISEIDATNKTAKLKLTVKISCYAIDVGARPDMGTVSIGTSSKAFSSEAIKYDGTAATEFTLATREETVTLSSDGGYSAEVKATWPFNGTYSGVEIKMLEAGGTIGYTAK